MLSKRHEAVRLQTTKQSAQSCLLPLLPERRQHWQGSKPYKTSAVLVKTILGPINTLEWM